MESPVGTRYELRSHSLLPVGTRMTDKADSCSELSTSCSVNLFSMTLPSILPAVASREMPLWLSHKGRRNTTTKDRTDRVHTT